MLGIVQLIAIQCGNLLIGIIAESEIVKGDFAVGVGDTILESGACAVKQSEGHSG